MPANWLIGITRSKEPNSASLISSAVFMVGMRAAQLEKQSPDKKKKLLSATRCLVLSSIESYRRIL
jgi:hypothetical protein